MTWSRPRPPGRKPDPPPAPPAKRWPLVNFGDDRPPRLVSLGPSSLYDHATAAPCEWCGRRPVGAEATCHGCGALVPAGRVWTGRGQPGCLTVR